MSFDSQVNQKGFEPLTHSLEGCCSNPTELLIPIIFFGDFSPKAMQI